jgi:hydroxyacylglutathione hydrolase
VQPKLVQPEELDGFDRVLLLDMRNKTEYAEGNIPGAVQLSGGRVMWNLDQLPRTGTIVTYCRSGVRNGVAASALRREGFDIAELDGSYLAWEEFQKNALVTAAA